MKIYARQIAPEYQESPLFYEDMFPDNMIVSGNRHYKEHTTPTFDQINRYFDEMAGAWEDANFYYQYSGNGRSAVVVNPTGIIFIFRLMNGAPKQ